MSAAPMVVEVISLFFLVLFILHKYADFRKQNKLVLIATFISWYFSFMIIVLLPLDISMTTYRQCIQEHDTIIPSNINPVPSTEFQNDSNYTTNSAPVVLYCKKPWSMISTNVFPVLWRVIYYSSQLLTWLILPFMQSFAQSGEFTLSGKIKGSLIHNAIYYGTYMAIFSVLLIYVGIKHTIDGQKLKIIGITASNTWGLFLLVLLLGYGLVEVPRTLWYRSTTSLNLKQIYFKIAKLHGEKCDAEENLEDILNEVKKIAEKIRYNHSLRNCIDLIVKKCPENFQSNLRRNNEDYRDYDEVRNNRDRDIPSEKSLVSLHTRLIKSLQVNNRTSNQWKKMMEEAFLVEDVLKNESNSNMRFLASDGNKQSFIFQKINNPLIEWMYRCKIKKYLLKTVSILMTILTFMVIWSEMTFFNKKPVLSLFAIFLNTSRETYNYFSIEIVGLMVIAYLCFCAYYTLFKMRVFNYYYLAPNHQTNEYSLIFSGMLLCRLTSPLCYNFLGLVHLDSHITKDTNIIETQFTSIMGHMDVISVISDGFNIYFPMLIFLLCLATFFNLGQHTLHFFGFEQFIGDTDLTIELIDDGKNLVGRERRRIEIQNDRSNQAEMNTRHQEVAERLKNNYSSQATDHRKTFRARIKEYRDIPAYENLNDGIDNDEEAIFSQSQTSNSRLVIKSEDPIDYSSTNTRNNLFSNSPTNSQNSSMKNMKGIFDDV